MISFLSTCSTVSVEKEKKERREEKKICHLEITICPYLAAAKWASGNMSRHTNKAHITKTAWSRAIRAAKLFSLSPLSSPPHTRKDFRARGPGGEVGDMSL